MIEDLTTTIKAQLYERVSSPLLSSFVISWCAWNYKFLLIVFSGMSSFEKITYIDRILFPDITTTVIHGAILPLVTSLLLIFAYPIPAEFIYKHVKIKQRRLKEIQQSIDDDSPISKEQARKLRREAVDNRLKYEVEIDAKNAENSRLKEMVSELQLLLSKATESQPPLESLKDEPIDASSNKEPEPADEDLSDLLAVYESAKKGEPNRVESNTQVDDFKEDDRQHILDMYMKGHLLSYIGKLISFSGVEYDVSANNGKLKVLLRDSDGEFLPYVSGDYDFDSALQVLVSVKNALANDSPPKFLNRAPVGGEHLPSHNFRVVRDYIVDGVEDNKPIPEIRRDLLEMGVPESVFNTVIADLKISDTTA